MTKECVAVEEVARIKLPVALSSFGKLLIALGSAYPDAHVRDEGAEWLVFEVCIEQGEQA